ncbi:MAG: WD40 repeat domain-containing protein [Promethearchaeota archaeon]
MVDMLELIKTFQGHKTLALTSDHQIQLFNLVNTEIIESINLKPKRIYDIAFSPNGKLLAMSSANKNIRIWPVS